MTTRLAIGLLVALLPHLACAPPASDGNSGRPEDRSVHFLIPGAPGGGWDGTARGVGHALRTSGLVSRTSFENLSGGGGGRALAHFIATAPRQQSTLMIGSAPFVISALRGRHPQTWRDLTPVSAVIGDYLAFAVREDSEIQDWAGLMAGFEAEASRYKFAGGSVLGGLDHLGTALALSGAGADAATLRYVPYDTGGKAMAALLSGETPVLTTGVGEAVEAWRAGLVRVLAVSAPERVGAMPDVPTLRELGTDVEFVNWRGFFGPPGLGPEQVDAWTVLLSRLFETPEWEEVRDRNGWVEIWRPGESFETFLVEQEHDLAALLSLLEP